jgi:predicted ATP-dependent endonuclease of OLD family
MTKLSPRLFSSGIITFRIGKGTELDIDNIPKEWTQVSSYLEEYPLLENQGDRFRSFVGIVLSILLCRDKIILIDEPEAFLHPTQIRVLGRWIGEFSDNTTNQIIITTHNSNFLKSIANSNKIKIFRLDRNGNHTSFKQLSFTTVNKISENPILSNLSVLDSIFYNGVILCEGDTDRIFYKVLLNGVRNLNEDIYLLILMVRER